MATALVCGGALSRQLPPPARDGSEADNFGEVPCSNPQIIITRAEDRAAWRQLEERRDLEDRFDKEFRELRERQAAEREQTLKRFGN